MKQPTPPEVLHALADGKIVRGLTGDHRFVVTADSWSMQWRPSFAENWSNGGKDLDAVIRHARYIIDAHQATADKS